MAEMKPTKVEWWPLPRPGELVPDYPPQDITGCFSSVEMDGPSPADWVEELLGERLEPFQRHILNGACEGTVDVRFDFKAATFIAAVERMQRQLAVVREWMLALRRMRMRRLHVLYRRRQLARRRRRRR